MTLASVAAHDHRIFPRKVFIAEFRDYATPVAPQPLIVKDIQDLLSNAACAERRGLTLVTTEKDMARLRGNPAAAELTARLAVLPVPVALRLSDAAGLEAMLRGVIREGAA